MVKIITVIGVPLQISSDGNHIINTLTGKEYTKYTSTSGYLYVAVKYKGKRKNMFIHRLVALAFIENIDSKPQVNHIDEVITHNDYRNLEWVTNEENSKYGNHNINMKTTITNKYGAKCYIIDHNNSDKLKYFSSIRGMCTYIGKSSGYVTTMFKNKNNKFTIPSLGITLVRI